MKFISSFAAMSAVGILSAGLCPAAHASTIVLGTSVISAAGTQSGNAAGDGGTVPVGISVAGDVSLTFSVSGSVSLNSGGNTNDADGVGAAVSSSSTTSAGSISGITIPDAGGLVGVFVAAGGPTGAAPASLNFVTGGTSFTSLSPLLDQVFFIGDGLTGDGTGTTQTFVVPTGAGTLYLGISDAGGYNGSPGSYGDNSGQFSVTATATVGSGTPAPTPEPSSLMLLGTGALAGVGMIRRRLATR